MASHQAVGLERAADKRAPQVSVSAGTPIPKNEREASVNMALAIPKAIAISTGDNALGMAWRNMVRVSEYPSAWAASMYSRLLILNNSARINRAMPIHEVAPIITITSIREGLPIATIAIIRNKVGIDIIISIARETTISMGIFTRFDRKGNF